MYATLVRSFSNKKNQIVEVFNESIVLVLMLLLTRYNTEEQWTNGSVHIFIAIILFQAYTLLLVTVIGALIKFYKFIKSCMTRTRIANFQEDQSKETQREEEKEVEASSIVLEHSSQESMIDSGRSHHTVNLNTHTTYHDLEEELKQCADLNATTIHKQKDCLVIGS